MSRFDDSAESVLEALRNGANLRESARKTQTSYATVRSWIAEGRRNPASRYGPFARGGVRDDDDGDGHHERGPVATQIAELLDGRELHGDAALAAEQARVLAYTARSGRIRRRYQRHGRTAADLRWARPATSGADRGRPRAGGQPSTCAGRL